MLDKQIHDKQETLDKVCFCIALKKNCIWYLMFIISLIRLNEFIFHVSNIMVLLFLEISNTD